MFSSRSGPWTTIPKDIPFVDGHYRYPFLGRDLTSDEEKIVARSPHLIAQACEIAGVTVMYLEHPDLPFTTYAVGFESPEGIQFKGMATNPVQLAVAMARATTICHVADTLVLPHDSLIPEALGEFIVALDQSKTPLECLPKLEPMIAACGLTESPMVVLLKIMDALTDDIVPKESPEASQMPQGMPSGTQGLIVDFDQAKAGHFPPGLPPEVMEVLKAQLANLPEDGPPGGIIARRVTIGTLVHKEKPWISAKIVVSEISDTQISWSVTPNGAPEPVRTGIEHNFDKAEHIAQEVAKELLEATLN